MLAPSDRPGTFAPIDRGFPAEQDDCDLVIARAFAPDFAFFQATDGEAESVPAACSGVTEIRMPDWSAGMAAGLMTKS